jgi:hypothetical protein
MKENKAKNNLQKIVDEISIREKIEDLSKRIDEIEKRQQNNLNFNEEFKNYMQ